MNEGLELYKLMNTCDEFGWEADGSFYVWVNYRFCYDFMNKLSKIFGYGIYDDCQFKAIMQCDCMCIDLDDVLEGYIDLEEIFPKTEYKH